MPYVGKNPTIGNFVKLDAITTSATTTFNLTNGGVAYSPQSANHCIVSLNGVIQSPNTSFTISGSTIVFASALTSSDVIDFILVLGDVLNIGTPSDATVGFSKITSNLITGATAETSIAGGDQILIYDDSATALRKMTKTNLFSGIANTPIFLARANSQSIADNVETKIQFSVEDIDTASAYDNTTNYRFTVPSGQAGKYVFHFDIFVAGAAPSTLYDFFVSFRINGTQELQRGWNMNNAYPFQATVSGSFFKQMAVGEYAEVFCRCDTNGGANWSTGGSAGGHTMFMGYKLIE